MARRTAFAKSLEAQTQDLIPIFTAPHLVSCRAGKKTVMRSVSEPLEDVGDPPDRAPKNGDRIPLVHDGGSVKWYEFLDFNPQPRVTLWFAANTYHLGLDQGRLMAHGKPARTDWRCADPWLTWLRKHHRDWKLEQKRARK